VIPIAAAVVGFVLGCITGQIGLGILVGLVCLLTQAFGPWDGWTHSKESKQEESDG
jgi:hypothetical protein